jgi:hypothetical protein
MAEKFLIAPLNEGQQNDVNPWLIPDTAFESIKNSYIFRGKIRKRFGSRPMNTSVPVATQQLYSRLRVNVGVITAGTLSGNIPVGITGAIGQMFSVSNVIFSVTTAGLANMLSTIAVTTATFNTATGAFVITFTSGLYDGEIVYFYPSLPVMGFITYDEGLINNNSVIAFDTRLAYRYQLGGWTRAGAASWTGSDTDFFWGTTWRGMQNNDNLLFVVNYNGPDHIKYWNSAVWASINPDIETASVHKLLTSKILLAFRGRLIALNTKELVGTAEQVYANRARYCQNGSPLQVDAWSEIIPGKGGYVDAATRQAIVTAQILRDRLIVYFESSTWELVYTGNESLPFEWQKLNSELGAESTFSQILFDKVILGIGSTGIHACDGTGVQRIDDKIPQEVYGIHMGTDGPKRVCGIRDFYTEMVYWSVPNVDSFLEDYYKYPNKVIVYNYKTGSWAFNDDSITAFGYFERSESATWGAMRETWGTVTDTWGGGALHQNFKQILAGNQQGFTFLLDVDNSRNSLSLSITDINPATNEILVPNHNVMSGDYVLVEHCFGITNINNMIFFVQATSVDTLVLTDAAMVGIYLGGGTLTRVSRVDITTKQYNFFLKEGTGCAVNKVDFLVDSVTGGQLQIEAYPSYTNLLNVSNQPCDVGTGILDLGPYNNQEFMQNKFWHHAYFFVSGQSVQFRLFYSDDIMVDPATALMDFGLNALMIHATKTGHF